MPTISHDSLRKYGAAIFAAAGFPADQGRDVTDHLVDSNLVGHDSHGIIRLPGYVKSVRDGSMKPVGTLKIVRETPVSLVIDAQQMQGIVLAKKAMEMAVDASQRAHIRRGRRPSLYSHRTAGRVSPYCRATGLYRAAAPERRRTVHRAIRRHGAQTAAEPARLQRAACRRRPAHARYDDKHGRRRQSGRAAGQRAACAGRLAG